MEACKLSLLIFLIAAFVLFADMKSCHSTNTNTLDTKTNTQFIKTSCNATMYPTICVKSLSSYSNKIKSSYPKLAYTALSLSLKNMKTAYSVVSKISHRKDLKPNEVAAVKDCAENMGDSIDEVQQSLKELKHLNGSDLDFHVSNIKTWVSGALSDDDTCMNGLEEESVNSEIKNTIRKNVLNVAHMTSNALAFLNSLNYTQIYTP